jgi:hypothetical protein
MAEQEVSARDRPTPTAAAERNAVYSIRVARLAHAAACPLLVTACERPLDPRIGEDCQYVEVRIKSGPSPTFTWTPQCRMGQLEVVHDATSTYAWHLRSDSAIVSGVRYGEPPSMVEQLVPATPLVAGDSYYVRVGRLRVGTEPVEYGDVGAEFFVP